MLYLNVFTIKKICPKLLTAFGFDRTIDTFLDESILGQMKKFSEKTQKLLDIKNRLNKNSSTRVFKKFPNFLGNIIKKTQVTLVKYAENPEKFVWM